MKFSSTTLLALVAGVNAHTLMSEFYIDGKAQGDATCIRMSMDAETTTDPIGSLSSSDMACGAGGTKGVARVCSAESGSTLTFEYREWPDDASRGSIDSGHKGPCAVYLKKVDDATTDTAAGAGWFKIWDEGYDESAGKWCTEKMIENQGRISIALPESLQGGDYLVRPELLALHNADQGDPQFYVGCAQVFVESTGTSLPGADSTVSIPGYVDSSDASVTFDIWAEPMALPYPIPGPAVYDASSSDVSRVAQVSTKQTKGLLSSDCVLVNANWCGTEVAQYSTEDDCWDVSAACWSQCTDCYDTAPPTGSSNCKIWEDKCNTIDNQCNAGNFNGPPNYMKVLTPVLDTISVPAALNAQAATADAESSTSVAVASSQVASSQVASSQAVSSQVVSSSSSSASMLPSDVAAYDSVASSSAADYSAEATTTQPSNVAVSSVVDYDYVTAVVTVYATQTAAAERSTPVEDTHKHVYMHTKSGHRRVRKAATKN